jgi:hypothetical protein
LKPGPHPRYQHLTKEEIDRMQADGLFIHPPDPGKVRRRTILDHVLIFQIIVFFFALCFLVVYSLSKWAAN